MCERTVRRRCAMTRGIVALLFCAATEFGSAAIRTNRSAQSREWRAPRTRSSGCHDPFGLRLIVSLERDLNGHQEPRLTGWQTPIQSGGVRALDTWRNSPAGPFVHHNHVSARSRSHTIVNSTEHAVLRSEKDQQAGYRQSRVRYPPGQRPLQPGDCVRSARV